MHPAVSVILPVFNGERYLQLAIESVLEQTVPLELIVVDDGSSDATIEIAQSYGDRIRYIRQENLGVAAARNVGVEAARCELLAFIDSDDLWPAGKLHIQVEALSAQPAVCCVMGKIQMFSDEDNAKSRTLHGDPYHCYVFGSAVIRRSVFEKVGRMDESMKVSSDMEWFVRMREQFHIEKMDFVSLLYRYRQGSLTFGKDFLARKIPLLLKQSLDRRRAATGEAGPLRDPPPIA